MVFRDDGLKNVFAAYLNLDRLHGVSTTKGCYVGQETYTAYIHHVRVLLSLLFSSLLTLILYSIYF